MKPSTIFTLAALAAGLTLAGGALVACSSDSSNPSPGVFDGGHSSRSSNQSSAGGHSSSSGSATTGASSGHATTGSTGVADASTGPSDATVIDASLPDVGACKSDAANCNSCYTPAQNPLNGCAPATANCIPFDNTRVPSGAP